MHGGIAVQGKRFGQGLIVRKMLRNLEVFKNVPMLPLTLLRFLPCISHTPQCATTHAATASLGDCVASTRMRMKPCQHRQPPLGSFGTRKWAVHSKNRGAAMRLPASWSRLRAGA
eukprot:scaffold2882_cov359-Pinguiococcus_pyrenoidosus.AAC.6